MLILLQVSLSKPYIYVYMLLCSPKSASCPAHFILLDGTGTIISILPAEIRQVMYKMFVRYAVCLAVENK
jgi:hypothetical protein